MTQQSTKHNIYTRVTTRILAELEKGVRPWITPWSVEHAAGRITRPLRHNGSPYRGVNVLLLWGEALEKGYAAPLWMTYKQSHELGAQVRKGEHGSLVVFADRFTKTETNDQGESVEHAIPFMKGYTVFNVEQIEGLPAHFYAQPVNPLPLSDRIEHADRFVKATGVTIHHGGNQACYAPSRDAIQLPPFEAFKDKESYYSTALHELTHWTRHETRLARDFGRQRFGDEAMPARNWSQNSVPPSSVPISASRPTSARITPPISATGSRSSRTIHAPSSPLPLTRNAPLTFCRISSRRRLNRPRDGGHKTLFPFGRRGFTTEERATALPALFSSLCYIRWR